MEAVWTLQCRYALTKLHGIIRISEEPTTCVVDEENTSTLQMEAACFAIMIVTTYKIYVGS